MDFGDQLRPQSPSLVSVSATVELRLGTIGRGATQQSPRISERHGPQPEEHPRSGPSALRFIEQQRGAQKHLSPAQK